MQIWVHLLAVVFLSLGCSSPKVNKTGPEPGPDDDVTIEEDVFYEMKIETERNEMSNTLGSELAVTVSIQTEEGKRVTQDESIKVNFSIDNSSKVVVDFSAESEWVDDLGEATLVLTATSATDTGELKIRIEAEKNGESLLGLEDPEYVTINVKNEPIAVGDIPTKMSLTTTDNKLSIYDGEEVDVIATVLDDNDLPVRDINVTLEIEDGKAEFGELTTKGDQRGQIIEGMTDRQGHFTSKLKSKKGQEKIFTINGSFIYNLIPYRAAIQIVVAKRPFGGIQFVSAEPDVLGIQGSGDPVSSQITFNVFGPEGEALEGYRVTFRIIKPDTDATLSAHLSTTNNAGVVSTFLTSGYMSGPILIEATANFEIIEADGSKTTKQAKAATARIVVTSGLPSTNHFTIGMSKFNVPAWEILNETVTVSVLLGDRFGNPIPGGTVVGFYSEAGVIESPARTKEDGFTSTIWHSGDSPRDVLPGEGNPVDGFVTILAVTVGSEFYLDYNANGRFDLGIDGFDTKNVDDFKFFDLISRPDDFRQIAKSDDDPTKSRFYNCKSPTMSQLTVNPINQDNPSENLKGIPDGDYDPPICYKEASLADWHFDDQSEPFLDEDSDLIYFRIFRDIISNGDFYFNDFFFEENAFDENGLGLDGFPAMIFDENENLKPDYLTYLYSRRIYIPSVPYIDYGELFIDESLDDRLLDTRIYPPEFDFINFLNYRLDEFNPPDGLPSQLKMIWRSQEFILSGLPIVDFIDPDPDPVDCGGYEIDPSYCPLNPQVRGNPFSGRIGKESFYEALTYFFDDNELDIPDGGTKTFRMYIGDRNGNPLSAGSKITASLTTTVPPPYIEKTYGGDGKVTSEKVLSFTEKDLYDLSPVEDIQLDVGPEYVLSHDEHGLVIYDFTLTNAGQSVPIINYPYTLKIGVESTHPRAVSKIISKISGTFLGNQ